MSRKTSKLQTLRIPKPCSTDWENMTGDDRIRFCDQCNKQVFHLSAMTERQAEAIIAATRSNLCVRITTRKDGSVVTTEVLATSQPRLHHIRRRVSPIATAVISAMMAFNPGVAAQTQTAKAHQVSTQTQDANREAQPQDTTSSLSGRLLNWRDPVIGARVRLINTNTDTIENVTFSATDGTFHFDNLQAGSYTLNIESAKFYNRQVQGIYLQQNIHQNIEIPMYGPNPVQGGPESAPAQTLRELYAENDLIVAAIVGESTEVETDDYPATLMKTKLHVASTLKGAHQGVVYVYHHVYQGDLHEFAKGNKLLVFLEKNEKDAEKKGGYEVEDADYGVKKISDADLAIYRERIKELAKIVEKKNNHAELLEWLIRCAEHQATRFEGAQELADSAARISDGKGNASETKTTANIQTVSADIANSSDDLKHIAALLTKKQKERLMNALFRTQELNSHDEELIRLARIWEDERLPAFLLSQLHKVQNNPTDFAREIMNTIVNMTNDEEIEEAFDAYDELVDKQTEKKPDQNIDEQKKMEFAKALEQRSELLKKFLSVVESKTKR